MGIGGATTLLVGSVTAKIRNLMPNATYRWTDSFIRSMIHVADLILCEQAGVMWSHKDITLTASATYFAVPTDVVWVGAVSYSTDGTTFNDGVLWPTTFNELDQLDPDWADTTGTKPTHYFLLSTPGTDGARIAIYPKMTSVTAHKIRLHGLLCLPDNNLSFAALTRPEKIEDIYYVPMVLALLYGSFDPDLAKHYWGRAMGAIPVVRSEYNDHRDDAFFMGRPESPAGGQFA